MKQFYNVMGYVLLIPSVGLLFAFGFIKIFHNVKNKFFFTADDDIYKLLKK